MGHSPDVMGLGFTPVLILSYAVANDTRCGNTYDTPFLHDSPIAPANTLTGHVPYVFFICSCILRLCVMDLLFTGALGCTFRYPFFFVFDCSLILRTISKQNLT